MTDAASRAVRSSSRAADARPSGSSSSATAYEPQELGEYLSALANSACLAGQPRGYLVFGIEDVHARCRGHASSTPTPTKGKGNQDLLPWLAAGLQPEHRL